MSKSIEQRIVEMQFNNRQFETGVHESIGSLNKLEKSLQLKDAAAGLNKVSEAGSKFSLAGIASSVDTIASKFSLLQITAITALQNIVNSAVNKGKEIINALTLEPVMAGFNEYELKMGSIQTIMAGSGESLEKVNQKLNELNEYSDKTIYSFSDMTTNIGKFTNAGVSLDKSVKAIQGISNAAALSGANANEASRAMYNFAQGISSGFIKLTDWKSIELANMATVEFKNQLIKGAVAAGTLKDAGNGLYQTYKGTLISATKGFNDSLEQQWLTSDVLINTLGRYADENTDIGKRAFAAAQDIKTLSQMFDTLKESAQSGWAQSWETIFGDFNEGKTLFTDLGATIGGMIQKSADARNELLKFWKDNGGRAAVIDAIKNSFEALNSVIKPVTDALKQIFPPVTGQQLVDMSKALEKFTEKLKIGADTADKIKRTFAGFFAVLDIGKMAIQAILGGLGKLVQKMVPASSGLLGFTASVGDWLVALDNMIKKGQVFEKAVDKIAEVIGIVSEKVGAGVTAIIGFFKQFGDVDLSGVEGFTNKVEARFKPFQTLFGGIALVFSKAVEILKKVAPPFYKLAGMIGDALENLQRRIMDAINKGNFSTILNIINTGLLGALLLGARKFINSMSKVSGGIAGILDGVKRSLEAFQSSLKAGVLLKIAISIGILAAALAVLSMLDSEKLGVALAAITGLFIDLFGSMSAFTKLMGATGFKGLLTATTGMIAISVAILILSSAMKKLAELDWEGIAKGLTATAALMAMLVAASKLMNNPAGIIKTSLGFILLGAAINILASAVKKLGSIDTKELAKGLLAVGVLMTELVLFMKATDMNKMGILKGTGILLLATSLVILSSAVKKISEIDLPALAKGLAGVGVMLAEMALFIKMTPDAKKVISTAIGMVILGSAMLIFASAIAKMGSMSLEQIGKGLLTMAGALTIMGLALKAMPKNMFAIGVGMVVVATSLVILSQALQTMGGMSWEEIAKGLIVLAGSLTIIAIALKFMTTALPGAAALLVASAALTVLAVALKILGSMSLTEIGLALIAMAGAFTVFGLAAAILAPLVPVMLGLAGAMALLGVGMLGLGAGMLLFSTALAALAVSGAAGATVFVGIVTSLIGLIPYLLEQIGLAIIAFASVIIEGLPVLLEAVKVIFEGIIKLLGELTPPLLQTVLTFILLLLTKLVEFVPKFVDAGSKIVIGLLNGIAKNIGGVVKAGIDIILNFLDGIRSKIPDVIDMAFKIIITIINGLTDAIHNNHNAIYDAVENLITAIFEAVTDLGGRLSDIGGNIIKGMINGIKNRGASLVKAAKGVVGDVIQGAENLLGINSPSKVFEEIVKFTGEGMVIGLNKMNDKVGKASEGLGQNAIDSMNGALGKVSDSVNADIDLQPTIRPVVDMTDVENGLKSTFDKPQTLDVSDTTAKVGKVAAQSQNRGVLDGVGTSTTTNNTDESKIEIKNYYTVRNDNDIKKISRDQNNLLNRYSRAKGVPVPT